MRFGVKHCPLPMEESSLEHTQLSHAHKHCNARPDRDWISTLLGNKVDACKKKHYNWLTNIV